MLFVKKFQNELLVVGSPVVVRQTYEHVERTTRPLNFKTFDAFDALKAMVPLIQHPLGIGSHPLAVTLQPCEVTELGGR